MVPGQRLHADSGTGPDAARGPLHFHQPVDRRGGDHVHVGEGRVSHPDWAVATAMLEDGAPDHVDIALLDIDAPEGEVLGHRSQQVEGLRALVHGHFVVDNVQRFANRWNIDSGASFPGRDRLTVLHVNARRIRARTFDVNETS